MQLRRVLYGTLATALVVALLCGLVFAAIALHTSVCRHYPICSDHVIVSLTTIPSRIALCGPVIDSLFNQDYPPAQVVVNIPKQYSARFANEEVVIPDFMQSNPRIIINRTRADYGPATKVVGLRDWGDLTPETIVLVTDDDGRKARTWSCALMRAIGETPGGVSTLHDREVYGGRGFGFRAGTLDLDHVADALERHPQCRLVDDDFFTHYCRRQGIPLRFIPFSRWYVFPETEEFTDKLRDQRGARARRLLKAQCAAAFRATAGTDREG